MTSQMVACHHLQNMQCQVEMVTTGLGVLAAWNRMAFDLILMDVNMPEMDGLQATHAIREAEKATGLHQIIYATTAMSLDGDRELCLAAGMDGYLTKPIRKRELEEALVEVTHMLGAPVCRSHAKTAPDQDEQAGEEFVIDTGVLLEDLNGDTAFAVEMAEMGCKDVHGYLAGIQLAIKEGDAKKLRVAAHTIKTTFSQWGATRAYEVALAIERSGAAEDVQKGADSLGKLTLEVEKVGRALRAFIKANRPG